MRDDTWIDRVIFFLGVTFLALWCGVMLFGCSYTSDSPSGTYVYSHGEGSFFCDDGWSGSLSVAEGATLDVVDTTDGIHVTTGGHCPVGFDYKLGDEPETEGWISQGQTCTYQDRGSAVKATLTSRSWLRFDDDGGLTDRQRWVYVFIRPNLPDLHCWVKSVAYGKKITEVVE